MFMYNVYYKCFISFKWYIAMKMNERQFHAITNFINMFIDQKISDTNRFILYD